MEINDIAKLFIAAVDKVDFYWNFYTLTLLAMIGWLVSTDKPLTRPLKQLISFGYLLFVAMNIRGLLGAYTLAEAIRQDLLAAASADPGLMRHTQAVLAQHPYDGAPLMVGTIHALLGAVVLAVIWRGRRDQAPQRTPLDP